MAYRGTPQLPWLGLAAPVGAAGCAVASAFVLIRSDGQSIHDWTLQPTVYLAIASASANILLHYPLAEGVNVAWWRRSLKDGTTVNDLHRYWDYGNSLWAASTSGRHFNLVALASIMAALAPINGPLQSTGHCSSAPPLQPLDLSRERPICQHQLHQSSQKVTQASLLVEATQSPF